MEEAVLNGESKNIVNENIEQLKKIFPDVFAEGKIDFEKLQAVLGENIEDKEERYNFTWNGKFKSLRLSQTPSTGTLRPSKEESKNWDTTQNLYIEGDNLEVLKLLQASYFNKIKMIYIDPPYNTGSDFVYEDDFKDNLQNYLEITGQKDSEGNNWSTNSETSGRYHTNWLNMMYPRLRLARNLLADDGVIFISIDDTEVANLRKICDEIFGEDNFISNICHKSRASVSNDKIISPNHNHILLYAKNERKVFANRSKFGLDPDLSGFNRKDENGEYKLVPVDGPGGAKKGNPYYEFLGIKGYWRYSQLTMQEKYDQGLIVKTEKNLQQKYYKHEAVNSRKTVTSWWDDKFYTSEATKKLNILFGEKCFDTPKPVELIFRMLTLCANKTDIVLDFFSGSATTAEAVMKYNLDKNYNIKYILVQLPELCNEKSEAFINGYKNICEIGKKRIDKSGEQIKEEYKDKEGIDKLDIGFKVLKLDSSNLKKWNPDYKNIERSLFDSVENYVEGRTELDVLYEIMIKRGIDLTLPIDEIDVQGKKVYSIGAGAMIVCLDDKINLDVANAIANIETEFDSKENVVVVFKDNGFENDSVKTNIKETLKVVGIKEFMTV